MAISEGLHFDVKFVVLSLALVTSLLMTSTVRSCEEETFEKREERAHVVLTGTVRLLEADAYNAAFDVALVEVKRTMKGKLIVQNQPKLDPRKFSSRRTMVYIHDIGNPKICESTVRQGDTRIFMLILDDEGKLRLNSSIVRLTLSNIRKAETAISSKSIQYSIQSIHGEFILI